MSGRWGQNLYSLAPSQSSLGRVGLGAASHVHRRETPAVPSQVVRDEQEACWAAGLGVVKATAWLPETQLCMQGKAPVLPFPRGEPFLGQPPQKGRERCGCYFGF